LQSWSAHHSCKSFLEHEGSVLLKEVRSIVFGDLDIKTLVSDKVVIVVDGQEGVGAWEEVVLNHVERSIEPVKRCVFICVIFEVEPRIIQKAAAVRISNRHHLVFVLVMSRLVEGVGGCLITCLVDSWPDTKIDGPFTIFISIFDLDGFSTSLSDSIVGVVLRVELPIPFLIAVFKRVASWVGVGIFVLVGLVGWVNYARHGLVELWE